MMSASQLRTQVLTAARALRDAGVAYRNGRPDRVYDTPTHPLPDELSCTQFLAEVYRRVVGDDRARQFVTGEAAAMFNHKSGNLTDVNAEMVLPCDIAFFIRDSVSPGDWERPDGTASAEWHAMLVTHAPSRVALVGACPVLGKVAEIGLEDYLALPPSPSFRARWEVAGFMRPPLFPTT